MPPGQLPEPPALQYLLAARTPPHWRATHPPALAWQAGSLQLISVRKNLTTIGIIGAIQPGVLLLA